jgi:hypothetical protein
VGAAGGSEGLHEFGDVGAAGADADAHLAGDDVVDVAFGEEAGDAVLDGGEGVPGAVVGSCCVYGVAWAQRTS